MILLLILFQTFQACTTRTFQASTTRRRLSRKETRTQLQIEATSIWGDIFTATIIIEALIKVAEKRFYPLLMVRDCGWFLEHHSPKPTIPPMYQSSNVLTFERTSPVRYGTDSEGIKMCSGQKPGNGCYDDI